MKVNLRQEVAMWVLGLVWTGLTFVALVAGTLGEPAVFGAHTFPAMLVLLVPIGLIVFSLRDREKSN